MDGKNSAGAGASPELLNSIGQAFLQFTEFAQQYPGLEASTFVQNLAVTLETASLLLQHHADVYDDDIFLQTLNSVLEYSSRSSRSA